MYVRQRGRKAIGEGSRNVLVGGDGGNGTEEKMRRADVWSSTGMLG